MTGLEEEREYLYWLCRTPLFGGEKIKRMWDKIYSFKGVYNIEGKRFKEWGVLSEKDAVCFDAHKQELDLCRREYGELLPAGIHFISWLEVGFPERLLSIPQGPAALFVKGELPGDDRPTAAIIGARSCSNYGLQIAEYMGNVLSREGIQIISGLAYGIDSAGHRGAVKGGYKTFGVLGCGVNICYPSENYKLFEQMVAHGGVLSEFLPGEPPRQRNFPMRNRIISGLSDVILVIEAKEKSGSLITVECGLEQGKDIYALPGRITDQLSMGCNQLIRAGAGILTSPYDITEYFSLKVDKIFTVHEKNANTLAKKEKMVYSCLDLQPKFLEEIVKESGLSVSECMDVLLELELEGFIVQISHQYYGKKL